MVAKGTFVSRDLRYSVWFVKREIRITVISCGT